MSTNRVIPGGTRIGTAGRSTPTNIYSLDFSIQDKRIANHGYFDASHKISDSYHVVCPFDYYDPSSAAWATATSKLGDLDGTFRRTDGSQCGKVDWQIFGTASGIWLDPKKDVRPESPHLTLMTYNIDPGYGIFSVGESIANQFSINKQGYVYRPLPQSDGGAQYINPDFDQIRPDGRIACFEGIRNQFNRNNSNVENWVIYLKLETEKKLKIEVVTGTSACTTSVASRVLNQPITLEHL